jgi:hypothetical protein
MTSLANRGQTQTPDAGDPSARRGIFANPRALPHPPRGMPAPARRKSSPEARERAPGETKSRDSGPTPPPARPWPAPSPSTCSHHAHLRLRPLAALRRVAWGGARPEHGGDRERRESDRRGPQAAAPGEPGGPAPLPRALGPNPEVRQAGARRGVGERRASETGAASLRPRGGLFPHLCLATRAPTRGAWRENPSWTPRDPYTCSRTCCDPPPQPFRDRGPLGRG